MSEFARRATTSDRPYKQAFAATVVIGIVLNFIGLGGGNGRLGFRTLDEAALSLALKKVWEVETAVGLPMAHRICMQLDL